MKLPNQSNNTSSTEKTVYKLSELPAKPIAEAGNEIIYLCPFCELIRGKPDTEGKLSFNKIKGWGHCFKCHIRIVDDRVPTFEVLKERGAFQNNKKVFEVKEFNLEGWSIPVVENSRAYQYLRITRGITSHSITRFQFRESGLFDGVIIPNPISHNNNYITNFCQVRYFDSKHYIRYLGVPNSTKPLYASELLEPERKVIICEGVFSAISAYEQTGIDSVAIYGSYLSKFQLEILREKKPFSAFVSLDGKELRNALYTAKHLSWMTPTYISFLPYGKDPAEIDNMVEILQKYTIKVTPLSMSKLNSILNDPKLNSKDKLKSSQDRWKTARDYVLRSNI